MPGKAPPERQCTGTSKQSGERCERWTTLGYTVCPSHGSKTPRGIAHHSFTHGRFSRSIPARLSARYEEALNDPRKLELADELAVIIARNRELLNSLYSGESDGLWKRLREHKQKMEKARQNGDLDAQAEHLNTILRLIEQGAADGERWAELVSNVDTQRKLVESERKRRVEDHQVGYHGGDPGDHGCGPGDYLPARYGLTGTGRYRLRHRSPRGRQSKARTLT